MEDDDRTYSVELLDSPFGGYLRRYKFTKRIICNDPRSFFNDCRPMIRELISNDLNEHRGLKYWLVLAATYRRSTDETETLPAFFPNDSSTVTNSDQIEPSLDASIRKVTSETEAFEQKGSDWVLLAVDYLDVYTVHYEPLVASSYVPLPSYIQKKRAVLNIHNSDQKCFLWSVLANRHHETKNAERVSKYQPYENELNCDGVNFPVAIRHVPKFIENNDISVNIYSYDKGFFPVFISDTRHAEHVNLLLYEGHYTLIRNFDRLMGDQTKHRSRGHYCDRCLFPFYSANKLSAHADKCSNPTLSEIVMPEDGENTLRFNKIHKMLRKAIVAYADIECILNPISSAEPSTSKPDSTEKRSFTHAYQMHEACSVGMVVSRSCCGKAGFDPVDIFTSENPVQQFLRKLATLAESYNDTVNCKPLQMSAQDEEKFQSATTCSVCEKPLDEDKVRDHCHTCGRFRSALHSKCNQLLRLSNDVTVVMHNLRKYDSHLIMKELGAACDAMDMKIECVAKGMEDYITFSISPNDKTIEYKIRFIDSVQFLSAPLEKLVEALPKDRFRAMKQNFTPDQLELLLRKGVFPYDLLSSRDMLNFSGPFTKTLFWNKLTGTNISDEDFNHFLLVWEHFGIEALLQYMELYLTTDVLLLADVFEAFREFCLEHFKLDPCHYATLPGLAWDAALKLTKVELELLTDPDKYNFFEAGIRGGISVISQREAVANNPYLEDYDATQGTSYVGYLDANNLYGSAMSQKLPKSDFRWVKNPNQIDVQSIDPDDDTGYVLEVDLEYPESLHNTHNCYPLAPEAFRLEEDMLSAYCVNILEENKMKYTPAVKLVPNLCNKHKYIVHIRNLQMYLRLGMRLKTIHRAISFKQTSWLEPYVAFNTKKRQQATSELDKNLHKLLVNAVFGKTMENVRKYVNVELVVSQRRLRKVVKKVHFKRASAFDDKLVGCVLRRTKVTLNKPIYAGFSILDLSKITMYSFHYDYMKPKYGEAAKLLMTDTDSLMYQVRTDDLYKDMLEDIDRFDTSEYPADHFLHSNANKKVLGKMKDELAGEIAREFIGLRSKMYSIKTGRVGKKRAKGVKRLTVARDISHSDYRATLKDRKFMHHRMNYIRSYKHQLFTVTLHKKTLGCMDDKRYILPDGVFSLAHGHYRIAEYKNDGASSAQHLNVSLLEELPLPALSNVLDHLGGADRYNVAATCQSLGKFVMSEYQWQHGNANFRAKDEKDIGHFNDFLEGRNLNSLRSLNLSFGLAFYKKSIKAVSLPSVTEITLNGTDKYCLNVAPILFNLYMMCSKVRRLEILSDFFGVEFEPSGPYNYHKSSWNLDSLHMKLGDYGNIGGEFMESVLHSTAPGDYI